TPRSAQPRPKSETLERGDASGARHDPVSREPPPLRAFLSRWTSARRRLLRRTWNAHSTRACPVIRGDRSGGAKPNQNAGLATLSATRPVSEITHLLDRAQRGDPPAAEELLPLVYGELRRLAAQRMAREAAGQTLQPTAL